MSYEPCGKTIGFRLSTDYRIRNLLDYKNDHKWNYIFRILDDFRSLFDDTKYKIITPQKDIEYMIELCN